MVNPIKKKVGIIGFGNMGASIGERLKLQTDKYQLFAFDKDEGKTDKAKDITVTQDSIELANKSDIVLLAVKPQDFEGLLSEIKNYTRDKLIISIAAGISTDSIERMLGKARVIRVMPNIALRIARSVTCLCGGAFAEERDLTIAKELFSCLGVVKEIKEEMINAATAISGSGPAYIFDDLEQNAISPSEISEQKEQYYIERLMEAAKSIGFNSTDAMFLAANTAKSSIELILRTKVTAAELKKQVSSKGGTTEAALNVLHRTGSWEMAAKAALKRAEELDKTT